MTGVAFAIKVRYNVFIESNVLDNALEANDNGKKCKSENQDPVSYANPARAYR